MVLHFQGGSALNCYDQQNSGRKALPLFLVAVFTVYTATIPVALTSPATCPLRLGHSKPRGLPTASPARLKNPSLFKSSSVVARSLPVFLCFRRYGFFFRSCRGGSCAFALARSVLWFCATRKTPCREYLTTNETVNQLSTLLVDNTVF